MKNPNSLDVVAQGFYTPSEDQIASLRTILENQLHQPVSLDEAQEVGIQLLSLYECLARDRQIHEEVRGYEQPR